MKIKTKASLIKRNWIEGAILCIITLIIGIAVNIWLSKGGPENWILQTLLYVLVFGCYASPIGVLVEVIKANNAVKSRFCVCGKKYDFDTDVSYQIVESGDDSVAKLSISPTTYESHPKYQGEFYKEGGKNKFVRVAIRCRCCACGRQVKERVWTYSFKNVAPSSWAIEQEIRKDFDLENLGGVF